MRSVVCICKRLDFSVNLGCSNHCRTSDLMTLFCAGQYHSSTGSIPRTAYLTAVSEWCHAADVFLPNVSHRDTDPLYPGLYSCVSRMNVRRASAPTLRSLPDRSLSVCVELLPNTYVIRVTCVSCASPAHRLWTIRSPRRQCIVRFSSALPVNHSFRFTPRTIICSHVVAIAPF